MFLNVYKTQVATTRLEHKEREATIIKNQRKTRNISPLLLNVYVGKEIKGTLRLEQFKKKY